MQVYGLAFTTALNMAIINRRHYTHLYLLQSTCICWILKCHIPITRLAVMASMSAIEDNGCGRQKDGQNACHNTADCADGTGIAASG